MKKLVLIACAVAGFVGSTFAGNWTQQSIGNFDYYHGPNGQTYTGQQIGNFYYLHGNGGYNGYGQRIGNFYYWHDNQ